MEEARGGGGVHGMQAVYAKNWRSIKNNMVKTPGAFVCSGGCTFYMMMDSGVVSKMCIHESCV